MRFALAVAAYGALAVWVFARGLRAYCSGNRFASFRTTARNYGAVKWRKR
jgi:hypothetical protein